MASSVPGYEYNADRDRRWRTIVDRFCVLAGTNEADDVVSRLVEADVRRVLEVGSYWGPVAERLSPRGVLGCRRTSWIVRDQPTGTDAFVRRCWRNAGTGVEVLGSSAVVPLCVIEPQT